MNIDGIKKALSEGYRLQAYIASPGDAIVIILMNGSALEVRGQHRTVHYAFVRASKDFLARGRPTGEVRDAYQDQFTIPSTAPDSLEAWLRKDQGNAFSGWQNGEEIVFRLEGSAKVKEPEYLEERLRTRNVVIWGRRGYTYRSMNTITMGGVRGTSTEVIHSPKNARPHCEFRYRFTKTAKGKDFWRTMEAAFEADEIEDRD